MREKLCPPPRARCVGEKTDIVGRGDGIWGGFPLSGGILQSLPIHPSFHNKLKKKIIPRALGLARPSQTPAWPPASAGSLHRALPSSPGSSPGPARPFPAAAPAPAGGKAQRRGGTGAGPGGPGGRPQAAPRTPRCSTIVPSQVPRSRLQLGFARRSHDVIRKSNHVF